MPVARVKDHVDQGLDRLLTQYKGKPRLAAWLTSYLRQVQRLDDAAYDVIWKRLIEYASDGQLDTIGAIVGEPRKSRLDDPYRVFIRARIRANRSRGKLADILAVFTAIEDVGAIAVETGTAIFIEALQTPATDLEDLFAILRDTKGGGVGLSVVVPTAGLDVRFLYRSATDPDDASTNGAGDASVPSTTFGLLSDALSVR